MMVVFQYQSRIVIDAWVESVRWTTLDGGETGTVQIYLPPDSAALDLGEDGEPLYLHDDRASWVEVHHPQAAVWYGATDTVTVSSRGVSISAVDAMSWTQERYCLRPRLFTGTPVAPIFEAAVSDSMEGVGNVALRTGAVCSGGPPIPDDYAFVGQSLADVIVDIIDMTGMSVEIDRHRYIHLVPYAGTYREVYLTDGLLDVPEREGVPGDAVSEVIGRNTLGQMRRVTAPEASPWRPRQIVIGTR